MITKIIRPDIPLKSDLEEIYNVCNLIGKNLKDKGMDVSKLFHTKEEIEAKKKDDKYKFI